MASVSPAPVFRRAAISWARSRELTPQRVWPLLRELGGIEAMLSASEEDLVRGLGSAERARALSRSVSDREADRWAADLLRAGIHLVTAFDEAYPRPLYEIPDPPFALFAAGNLERLRLPAVAVVGSRAASRYGREVAAQLGRNLSLAGVCVVSGFARGVDTAAHEAAREGPGGTIAVLGCGLDVDYPRENARLKESLSREHLFLSEYPPGEEPSARNFPIRNRIIAGLAAGVVVVEASRRSGSLITARLANDFGRDVFAVPGSVFSETSAGAHELLRDGAILCRGAEDVLGELFPAIQGARPLVAAAPSIPAALSPDARLLLEILVRDGEATADELGAAADLAAATVLAALFELEAAGLAAEAGPGRFSLADPALGIRGAR
ncbi:MAG TPA: DNA-processing protein DprA [Thermoanaerobaculia bacterium]|nr:DNA-processing protein DprA [Thermoanaerobaculia bacterium]